MNAIFKLMCIAILFQAHLKSINTDENGANGIANTHTFGGSSESATMQNQIVETTVTPPSQADSAQVHAVGLASRFFPGLMAHAAQTTEMQTPLHPDNPELHQLVKLVQSGLSEEIILSQIRSTTVFSQPSAADLLYLKENQVPEVMISALMEATGSASPEATMNTFNGLVFRRFFKDRSGALEFTNDKFVWRDASKDAKSFELFMNGIRQINLYSRIQETGNFYYRIQFEFTKGHNYAFEDVQKDTGGNENLMRLLEHLKHHFSNVLFVEKHKN